ncbi:hypothetical protein [Photobacterium sanctipauli]|uniref:hypothetical protein n=1 Tax=Photobacterium sanctipauli TaxID=1342794 RepID=UPI00056BE92A|nr:hypothetical protein [Photobacterium sanctipauli]
MSSIIKLSNLTALVCFDNREKASQVKQMFMKAGVGNVDVINHEKLSSTSVSKYDVCVFEYSYDYVREVSGYVGKLKTNQFFKAYPVVILNLADLSNRIDYDSAKVLDVDHIITGLINYEQFRELLNKLLSIKQFYDKVYIGSKRKYELFAQSVTQYTAKIKSKQLINLALEALYKSGKKNEFIALYSQYDRAEISTFNVIRFSEICDDSQRSISALKWVLKKNDCLFLAHGRLADEYQALKNVEATSHHRQSAFECHPADEAAFNLLVECQIKQGKLDSLAPIITKRTLYIAKRFDDYLSLVITLFNAFMSAPYRLRPAQYKHYIEPIIRVVSKRIPLDKKDEFSALVKLLVAMYLYRDGKQLKARAMTLDIYHNVIRRKRKPTLLVVLTALRALAICGEAKLCGQIVNTINVSDISKRYPIQFQWAAAPYSQLQKTYQWLKQQTEQRDQLEKMATVMQRYPFSFDLNCLLLTILLDYKEGTKQYSLAIIKRLKRCNYVVRRLDIASEVNKSQSYIDALSKNESVAKAVA